MKKLQDIPEIDLSNIILFGEIHGTKEIPLLLSKFFNKRAELEDFDIFLEYSPENQPYINYYLDRGEERFLRSTPIFNSIDKSDGKNSKEYFNLIKNVYDLNIKFNRFIRVICIDVKEGDNLLDRERILADNIKSNHNKKTFVILGNVHASTVPLIFDNHKIISAGCILRKTELKMVSISIRPQRGKFFNIEEKKIEDYSEFDKHFDHVYIFEESTYCSFLD